MKSFLLIVVLFFCVFNHVHPQSSWKLEKNSHGIKVYTRMTDESVIKEFKAITIIEADRKAIEHVITEVDKYVNWYPDVSESSVLEDVNSKEKIGYYKIDVPWPASDRDAVLKLNVKYSDEKKQTLISMKTATGYKSKVKGVVRLRNVTGFWKLTEVENGTKVQYQFLGDPGGNLPAWIINMMIVIGPFDTLVALKKKVK